MENLQMPLIFVIEPPTPPLPKPQHYIKKMLALHALTFNMAENVAGYYCSVQ